MKPLLSLKMLYRSPIKTVLTFILLAVVTFAFFSQTAEYAITAREMAEAAGQYAGVGMAEVEPSAESYPDSPAYINTDPRVGARGSRYQPLTQEQLDAVAALPYVTSTDARYMTAGVSDVYCRPDDGHLYYNYTARAVIEGTLVEAIPEGVPSFVTQLNGEIFKGNLLIIENCTLLAGEPPWAVDGETLEIESFPVVPDEGMTVGYGGAMQYKRLKSLFNHNYKWDTEYVMNMAPGGRYIFVLRFEPLLSPEDPYYLYDLGDNLSNAWCPAIWNISGAPDNYLDTEEFAPLRELIELTNADIHTFDMVYTDDMSAIMRFAEGKMAITDGRALTPEDSESGAQVCVVSREFAEENGLEVGGTLTMKLGTELFEQYKGLGAVAGTRERYSPAGEAVTLTIVGVYTDTDGAEAQVREVHRSYSASTIFIPKSLLPVDGAALADHEFSPSEFSLKIDNAADIPAFIEEVAPSFEEMGLNLIFHDDGWLDIARGFQTAKRLSLIRIAVLAAAAAAAIWFVVYLFIGRKRKEYAVMRALGTPRRASAKALTVPLMAVTVIAVLAGSCAAWIYTAKTIAGNETLAMMEERSVNTSVPAAAAVGCVLGEILLTLFIGFMILRRIGALPPLALLQDNSGGRKRARGVEKAARKAQPYVQKAGQAAVIPVAAVPVAAASDVRAAPRKSNSLLFVLRYILRHARRASGKSALAFVLAALLFAAAGQFALMKRSYIELCENTVVKANFVGGIQLFAVPQLKGTGYTIEPYYSASEAVGVNLQETRVVITNDIARYTGEEPEITYADGYDATCMDKFGNVIIAGETLMAICGLSPGGTVEIITPTFSLPMVTEYIGGYRENHPEETLSDSEMLVSQRNAIRMIGARTRTFTVAGVVTTPSGRYSDTAFAPGTSDMVDSFNSTTRLDTAEFTLANYRLAKEFRDYSEKLAERSGDVDFIMDTSKLDNLVSTSELLGALYPIAVAAALLIGGFLCALVIFQSAKEAAIMRVQGTTKRKTRAILALEQALLSVVGLLVGACWLALYNGSGMAAASADMVLFAGLYFALIAAAAIVSSVAATRKNVLELLQTKE